MPKQRLSNKMKRTMIECLEDALQIKEKYFNDDGEPEDATLAEIGIALLIDSAMPINKDTGRREIGDKRLLWDMMAVTKKEEEDKSELGDVLESLVERLAKRNVNLIEHSQPAIDAEVLEDE